MRASYYWTQPLKQRQHFAALAQDAEVVDSGIGSRLQIDFRHKGAAPPGGRSHGGCRLHHSRSSDHHHHLGGFKGPVTPDPEFSGPASRRTTPRAAAARRRMIHKSGSSGRARGDLPSCSASGAAHPPDIAVQFDHLPAAGSLMQAIDVLSNQGEFEEIGSPSRQGPDGRDWGCRGARTSRRQL